MACDEARVGELIHRIQIHVMPRRIRCKEFFTDADPLRCGRCAESMFLRGLTNMGLKDFTEVDMEILAHHFTEYGPRVSKPQVVNYTHFCDLIDEIFADETQQENMRTTMMSSSPGNTVMATFVPNDVEDEEKLMHALHRVAALCKARGVSIKATYVDLDRAPIPSPSMLNPRRGGKVTRAQFSRLWPFKTEMTPDEFNIIAEKYATGPAGDVHFVALHNEITAVLGDPAQPFPTSPLHLRPDDTEWSHAEIPVVQRITAKVVEKRMRLKEHFQDFDPLRRGTCTPQQVKTVFSLMNLSKDVDRLDFEALLATYAGDDGLFKYQAFVDDVDSAFTVPNLERQPLAVLEMPDATTTSPARRNTMRLSKEKAMKIARIEDRIRTWVRKRRCEMKPMFKDFDRPNRGYVSRNQFSRIMATMNIGLDEKAIGYLCGSYCDFGNHNDFNYTRFLKNIDPPAEDVEVAMMQMTSPHIPFMPRPYFNARGKVMPRSSSMPMLLSH